LHFFLLARTPPHQPACDVIGTVTVNQLSNRPLIPFCLSNLLVIAARCYFPIVTCSRRFPNAIVSRIRRTIPITFMSQCTSHEQSASTIRTRYESHVRQRYVHSIRRESSGRKFRYSRHSRRSSILWKSRPYASPRRRMRVVGVK